MHAVAKFLGRNKGFITFMLCMVVFRSAVAGWSVVPTGSMQPTIRIGDRINGTAASYVTSDYAGIHDDLQKPARYAIEHDGAAHHAIRLSVNWPSPYDSFGPVTVPRGNYLLLGNDRDNSMDSRYFGFFPRTEIVGRSRYVAASLDPDHHYLPRLHRFGASLD